MDKYQKLIRIRISGTTSFKHLSWGGVYAVTHTHTDWYFDSECPSEDVSYYMAHKERRTSFNNHVMDAHAKVSERSSGRI